MNRDDDRSLRAFRENEKLIASDDARRIDTQGLYRGEQLRLQAASARRAGRSAERMGYLNGATTLLSTGMDVYKYRNQKGGITGTPYNTAGWTSVEVAGKIIEKIGPILATKYIEG